MSMIASDDPIRFSARSIYSLPIFTNTEYYFEDVPCTIWGRWFERTGVLWLECCVCDDHTYTSSQLSKEQIEKFEDALLNEVCMRFF